MAKWANVAVYDNGLLHVKNNAIRMVLLKAYTANDSYATVVSNAVCSVPIAAGDMTIGGASGQPRTITVAGKSANATADSGATPDLHVALTNNVDTVYFVTQELSDQEITNGNTINFPSWTGTLPQPV